MIVGTYFDGDEDSRTAWEQHGVYGDALHVVVDGCRGHVTFAVNLLGLQWGPLE